MDIHETIDILRHLILLEDQSFYDNLQERSKQEQMNLSQVIIKWGDPREWDD